MLEKLLRLGKEAAIYGLSSILGRFLNFLLVPFYTNYLLPSEYGVVATLYAYIAFMVIVYGYGMEAAFMRFVSTPEHGDAKQNFSTPFISLLGTSLLFSLVIHFSARSVAGWIGIGEEHEDLIRYAGWILFFDTLVAIPYASLRMDHKAMKFAGLRVLNILCNIALNILFIVGMGMKAEGVFLANLLALAFSFLLLFRTTATQLTIRFSRGLYRDLLKFGLPYVPAGIAGAAMQVIDRPILKALTDDATVGVYQANYRLGVLMMLVVGMFDYAWRPFFLQHAKDEDAKDLFARVFTYFVALMLFILISVSLFVEDLVRIQVFGKYFIHPDYWTGLTIVPIILLSYIFTGAYVNFVVGIYLEKKTKVLPYVTGAGAIVNVAVNYWLIPPYGIMGAAFATLASYVVMAAGMYIASQRVYPIKYEWSRILRLAALTALVFAGASLIPVEPASVSGLAI
ncbi:MAG: polysaccharide biosynthesis C-terminal domain-containing protein, partial [Bacteroidota bacterium]